MQNYDLIQKDGAASKGGAVTNYTMKPNIAPQPQVPGKTPFHSRTCSDMSTYKK
jgi:hypothetical protein